MCVASFNEKLVVNNGQVVSPQPLRGSTTQLPPSMNQLIYQINNEKDFDDYILKHASKVPSVRSDLQYVKHPSQAPTQAQPAPSPAANANRRTSLPMQNQPPPSFAAQQPESAQSPTQFKPAPQPEPAQHQSYQSYNPGFSQQQQQQQQPPPQQYQSPYGASAYSPVAQNPYSQPEYPRGPAAQATAQQTSGVLYSSSSPPVNPVFGVSLDQLFTRDGSPVPLVVYQCIQAVDLYGLEVEGIYRIPGTASHIQAMKSLFDSGPLLPPFQRQSTDICDRCNPGRLPQPRSLPTRCQQRCRSAKTVLPRATRPASNTRLLHQIH